MSLEVEGGLELRDVLVEAGGGVTEGEDAVGGEEGVLRFLNSPDFFEDGDDLGIVLDELGAAVRVVVVFVEVGFSRFGEVFHLVRHGVGFALGNTVGLIVVAGALGEVDVGAGFFGSGEGGEEAGVIIAKDVVVVGVGEFVEGDVWHAAGLVLELVEVAELDRFGHFDRFAVIEKPLTAGVVAGSVIVISAGGEEEGDFFEIRDEVGGKAIGDGLELLVQQVEGSLKFWSGEVLVKDDGPAGAGLE